MRYSNAPAHTQIPSADMLLYTITPTAQVLMGRPDHVFTMKLGMQVVAHEEGLLPQNALELVAAYDVVVDASDNAPTRYLASDACCVTGKPLVSGAALGMDGQLSTLCVRPDGGCLIESAVSSRPKGLPADVILHIPLFRVEQQQSLVCSGDVKLQQLSLGDADPMQLTMVSCHC